MRVSAARRQARRGEPPREARFVVDAAAQLVGSSAP